MAKKDAAPKQKTSKPKAPRKPKSADVGTPAEAHPAIATTTPQLVTNEPQPPPPPKTIDEQLLELRELIGHLRDAPHSAVRSVVNDAELRIDAIRSSLP